MLDTPLTIDFGKKMEDEHGHVSMAYPLCSVPPLFLAVCIINLLTLHFRKFRHNCVVPPLPLLDVTEGIMTLNSPDANNRKCVL